MHKKLNVAFIDFRKAFDSVTRTKLWAILRRNSLKEEKRRRKKQNVLQSKVRAGNDLTVSFMSQRSQAGGKG